MRREKRAPRANWRQHCEDAGFSFHSMGGTYWEEAACYSFSAAEVDRIEEVTAEMHQLCLNAADEVVRSKRFAQFAIPEDFHDLVTQSWREREATLYGRFDFSWNGEGEPKLLEYNADTPTALLEASVVQWQWLEDVLPNADQFNSLHEKLIERLKAMRPAAGGILHLACVKDNDEDLGTVEYLRDCALQAGWDARRIDIEDLGWDGARFADLEEAPVSTLFKLYPWEWMAREAFGEYLLKRTVKVIEPPWKMLLSNKAILPILWEMFPDHANLLAASFEPGRFATDYVKKPLYSREGANVSITSGAGTVEAPGEYGAEGFIWQAYHELPRFDGNYTVIGSWIVGEEPAGIGIREDSSPITRNSSRFVPHYFV